MELELLQTCFSSGGEWVPTCRSCICDYCLYEEKVDSDFVSHGQVHRNAETGIDAFGVLGTIYFKWVVKLRFWLWVTIEYIITDFQELGLALGERSGMRRLDYDGMKGNHIRFL